MPTTPDRGRLLSLELQRRNSTGVVHTADDGCAASRHGTRAAYVAGCRCAEARRANREYAKYRDRRSAQAMFGAAPPFSVPAADAVAVLEQLRGVGWSLRRVEDRTGIGRDHISRIYGHTHRPLKRVRWATYQQLRSLLDESPPIAGGALVDAYSTWQRIRGLIALGYPKTWIAQQLGVGRALQLDEFRVTARNAAKVAELVDQFGATRGPSDRARSYASARGWTPDLIWTAAADDDFDVDDMAERADVDEVAVDRFVLGDLTVTLNAEERFVAWTRLAGRGTVTREVHDALRLNGNRIAEYRARAEDPARQSA